MNEKYVEIFMEPLYECLNYNPKFGHSAKEEGYTLDEFLQLYGEDPFYSWIGLDSPYMFAAHKAAGCMTSIYRQIGIGCERLARRRFLPWMAVWRLTTLGTWMSRNVSKSGLPKAASNLA